MTGPAAPNPGTPTPAVPNPAAPNPAAPIPGGLAEASDKELMAWHVAGDPAAFGEIFRRHHDRMWSVALRTCRDPDLAGDCVQDAFIAAFRRAGSYRGDAAVTTWLHRIVVNACLDRLRRHRPTASLSDYDPADSHDQHSSTEVRLDVRDALDRLPEGQRLALILVDMHGLAVSEAAEALGVAEGTIKSRCARGRSAMAELLGIGARPQGRAPTESAGREP